MGIVPESMLTGSINIMDYEQEGARQETERQKRDVMTGAVDMLAHLKSSEAPSKRRPRTAGGPPLVYAEPEYQGEIHDTFLRNNLPKHVECVIMIGWLRDAACFKKHV